jgi:hypothetical protein
MSYLCSIYVHLCLQKGDDCDNPHFGTPWCPVILVNSVIPRIGILFSNERTGPPIILTTALCDSSSFPLPWRTAFCPSLTKSSAAARADRFRR